MDDKIITLPPLREPAPAGQQSQSDLTVRGISLDPFLLVKKKKNENKDEENRTVDEKTPKKRIITTN
jgi:hypothetical protein